MPAGKFSVSISDLAIRDIDGLILYTAEIWGEAKTREYAEGIYQAIDALRTYPELGEKGDEAFAGQRSLPYSRHVIYYDIGERQIFVLRVLHQRASANRRF